MLSRLIKLKTPPKNETKKVRSLHVTLPTPTKGLSLGVGKRGRGGIALNQVEEEEAPLTTCRRRQKRQEKEKEQQEEQEEEQPSRT